MPLKDRNYLCLVNQKHGKMTCEHKLVIQIVAGEVQKVVVYYMCSGDNCKLTESRELKGKKKW